MKIVLTVQEIKAGAGICNQFINSANDVAKVLGGAIENLVIGSEISQDEMDKFNTRYKGIASIIKNSDNYTLDINEEFVIESCDLYRDAIIDFYDVIKYSIKTFKAFAAISIKPFTEKWQRLISKNIMKN